MLTRAPQGTGIALSRRDAIATLHTACLIIDISGRPAAAATAAPTPTSSTATRAPARNSPPLLPSLADLARPGPYAFERRELGALEPAALPGLPADIKVSVQLLAPPPSATPAAAPLVVFSPGFLLRPAQYAGVLGQLASWGLPVATYEVAPPGAFLPDPVAAAVIAAAAERAAGAVGSRSAGAGARERAVLLAGHSRGAKLSALAAEALAARGPWRVALGLIDPVDQTYDAASAPGCACFVFLRVCVCVCVVTRARLVLQKRRRLQATGEGDPSPVHVRR